MRLNRFLAACGLGSRRSCEELIRQGRVFIGGELVQDLSRQVEPGDQVQVDGREVQPTGAMTLVLKKPAGYLCSRQDETGAERPTVFDLLPPHLRHLNYVGRLDLDSEGLLVMTTAGELADKLTHPRFSIEKEYLVGLDHVFREEDAQRLREGFPIEGGFAKADAVSVEAPRVVSVTLTQGIKRQVRLMFEHLGYEVRRLERIRIGGLVLPKLRIGRWRILTRGELAELLRNPAPTGERPGRRKPAERPGGGCR